MPFHARNESGALQPEAGCGAVGTADLSIGHFENAHNLVSLARTALHHHRRMSRAVLQFVDRQVLMEIAKRYGQEFVGPALQPKS